MLQTLPSLPLVHVWIPDERVVQGTNGPAWSLACEVFFYALFPVLLVAATRIRPERLWHWLFGTVGVLLALTLAVGLLVPSEPTAPGLPVSLHQFYLLILLPPVRLLDFVLGILIARLVLAGRWPPVRWSWVGAALVLGWVLGTVVPRPLGFVSGMVLANVLLRRYVELPAMRRWASPRRRADLPVSARTAGAPTQID